jgi:microcystin degradation protein MlrC
LHGAGVVEGIEDLEGDLCEAVRNVIGEAVPMTAGFDLHGNVTQRWPMRSTAYSRATSIRTSTCTREPRKRSD